jgi:transcription termination factor Rho
MDINRSSTRKEELLMSADVLNKIWILRKFLAEMNPIEAMEFLLDRLKKSKTNQKFLASMKD